MADKTESRPFHESIVQVLRLIDGPPALQLIGVIILMTKIPRGHDEIVEAWQEAWRRIDENSPWMIRGVTSLADLSKQTDSVIDHLRRQKAAVKAAEEMAEGWSMERLQHLLRQLDALLTRYDTDDYDEISRLLVELAPLASAAAKAFTCAEASVGQGRPVFLDELEEGIDPDDPDDDQVLALSPTQVRDLLRSPSGDGDPNVSAAIPHGLTVEVFSVDQLPSRFRPDLPPDHGNGFAGPYDEESATQVLASGKDESRKKPFLFGPEPIGSTSEASLGLPKATRGKRD